MRVEITHFGPPRTMSEVPIPAPMPWEWTESDFRWVLERMYGLVERDVPTLEHLGRAAIEIMSSSATGQVLAIQIHLPTPLGAARAIWDVPAGANVRDGALVLRDHRSVLARLDAIEAKVAQSIEIKAGLDALRAQIEYRPLSQIIQLSWELLHKVDVNIAMQFVTELLRILVR